MLLRQEDPAVLKVKNFKNKRKRVVSDSGSETDNGFPLSSVKLPLEELRHRKHEQEILIKPFIETPICSKLIRCKSSVKPAIQQPPSPPPNNTLSERVMVWLDLATNSENPPKVEVIRKSNRRAMTAKQKKVEILLSPKSPIKEKTCRLTEYKLKNELGEAVTKVKRQALETKRELHIFLPELPKKVGSDISSVLSSKCSSLKKGKA